jgi:sugar phosphate isomerase/epimerase
MRNAIALFVLHLSAASLCAASPVDGVATAGAPDSSGAQKLGWKLTLQSWTTNKYTVVQSIDYAKQLGVHYLEVYPGQPLGGKSGGKWGPDMKDDQIKEMLDAAKAAGVEIIDTGVIDISGREDEARKLFDWAKKIGITEIVSEPDPRALPMIDKLAGEYGIKVAIHDHPKGSSRYWDPEFTYEHIKDLQHVGFCADVGHWKRSGFDPVVVLDKYGEKVYSLHFKDLVPNPDKKGWHDVPWGTGESKAAAMLETLKKKGFQGPIAIEYESTCDVPMLKKCVGFFNEQANKLAQ